jgi:hypothetical protein
VKHAVQYGIWVPTQHLLNHILAVTLQLDDITVGANRRENIVPSGILIITRVTLVTLM